MPMHLGQSSLDALPASVRPPFYDRSRVTPGIVHFGVGNFHRAHMAAYLDECLAQGGAREWGIVGAGLRPEDAAMRARLEAQDWLSTLVEMDNAGTSARVIGAMIDFLDGADRTAIAARLAQPSIRVVSLTITEGGYFIDPATAAFDADHPAMVRDGRHPHAPETIFGLLVAALAERRRLGRRPFTVLCCDNIPGNGNVARDVVAGLAGLSDPGLAAWIRGEVPFPNGMVDRITPATSDRERQKLARDYGLTDAAPVFCESFRQWVIEDRFADGRPEFERVGAQFVGDVEPFERMKMRILNAGHAAIGYPAALLGLTYIHEAMADRQLAAFLRKLEGEEIIPLVAPVPGTDLAGYLDIVCARFANRHIEDTVTRVCFDGSNRQPKYVLPIVRDGLKVALSVGGLALVSAFWARYCHGTTESGATIAANDPSWPRLQERAQAAREDARAFLALDDIFGAIAHDPRYVDAFERALDSIWRDGVRSTLDRYIGDTLF